MVATTFFSVYLLESSYDVMLILLLTALYCTDILQIYVRKDSEKTALLGVPELPLADMLRGNQKKKNTILQVPALLRNGKVTVNLIENEL